MSTPLYWSDAMNELYTTFVSKPVAEHPGTRFRDNLLMGYPFKFVREEVIAKGLADFATGYTHQDYGSLTAEEKALLYSFINFKKHFYACRQTYDTYRAKLNAWLTSAACPTVVDIGCGPGTAGLALCETILGANWDYLGIDTAPAMRELTSRFMGGAQAMGLFGPQGSTATFSSWSECSPEVFPRSSPLLIVCSYLFANSSLNAVVLQGLADWVRSVCEVAERPVALLVYLNSTNPYANTRYNDFKALLNVNPQDYKPVESKVEYLKNWVDTRAESDTFLHELLILKRAT